VAVIPCEFGWSDVGSWSAVRDLVAQDGEGNRALGEAIFVDSTNAFVQSEDRLVATVGVRDLMIIDSADALLVAHQDKSQDVKRVVAQLKKCNHDAFKLHPTVVRPWGVYTVLGESVGYKVKRIEVKPGASLSLQLHHQRSEHWVVVQGVAKVTNGDDEVLIGANESTYIQAGKKHRLENPGSTMCVMIEVQCGSYLGEDDIVRFEDKYGR
jgi:mannose-1-phosphate guanylyltransferase